MVHPADGAIGFGARPGILLIVVTPKFIEEQPQIPFGVAQGRLSTHHPQTEVRLGPLSLRMTGPFIFQDDRAFYISG
jgi:hypothetical protein